MIWFTADLHFGHENVIKFSNRPFSTVSEMDEAIIKLWNKLVEPRDTVFVLGDFSFHYGATHTSTILARLPGNKVLIRGNHDHRKTLKKIHGWTFVRDYYDLKHKQEHIVLSHYAFEVWRDCHHGSWHLHGHSHGTLPVRGKRMDVGIDALGWDMGLINFDGVRQILSDEQISSADYHGKREDD